MNNKINNKMSLENKFNSLFKNKDYIGYSFWKNLRGDKIQIDINPIVETVIEKYEENKIPYLKSEIEDKVWSKIYKHRYDVMEYLF